MRARGGGRGFTLVELLLAVAMMAVIAPAIGRSLINTGRHWRETRAEAERRRAARGALTVFERDVRRFLNAPGVAFSGAPDRVEFVAVVPVVEGARVVGFKARRVRYAPAGEGWVRTESPARPDDTAVTASTALPGRVTFDYGAMVRRGGPSWQWTPAWTAETPPRSVRAVLRAPGGRGEIEMRKTVPLRGGDDA